MDGKTQMLDSCKFIKTILMLTVIFGHGIAYWSGDWFIGTPRMPAPPLKLLFGWIGAFHTYGFALTSGYIFAFKMRSGGYKSYLKFIKNKARRLILPYVFVAFLWVVPVSFCFFKWNINVIIHDFALGVNPHHLWFLLMLFEVFVLCWPLWPILTARGVKGAAAILIIFGMGAVLGKVLPNIYCIWTACGYIPFFYIGILYALQTRR